MKLRNILIPLSVFTLLAANSGWIHAEETDEAKYPGDSATSTISLEVLHDSNNFSVTVPLGIPLVMTTSGNIITPSNILIKNNSIGAVQVENIEFNGMNGWRVADYDEVADSDSTNEKKIGFMLNGAKTKGEGALLGYQIEDIRARSSVNLDLDAVAPPQTFSGVQNVAKVVFTVDWVR